jgi:hypothetical protein
MKKRALLVPMMFLAGVTPAAPQGAAHEKVEVGWPRAFAKAKWPTCYLAATSITGPGEAWFMTGYPSYAAYEAGQKRLAEIQSAALISSETNHFAFSPAMSYVSAQTIAADPALWTLCLGLEGAWMEPPERPITGVTSIRLDRPR